MDINGRKSVSCEIVIDTYLELNRLYLFFYYHCSAVYYLPSRGNVKAVGAKTKGRAVNLSGQLTIFV